MISYSLRAFASPTEYPLEYPLRGYIADDLRVDERHRHLAAPTAGSPAACWSPAGSSCLPVRRPDLLPIGRELVERRPAFLRVGRGLIERPEQE